MSDTIEPSLQFVATSIPTEDFAYLHFSDRQIDPNYYVLIQGAWGDFKVSLKAPNLGVISSSMGLKTCHLGSGQILIQLESSLFHGIEGSGQVRITFDVVEHNMAEIRRQLIAIIGIDRLT